MWCLQGLLLSIKFQEATQYPWNFLLLTEGILLGEGRYSRLQGPAGCQLHSSSRSSRRVPTHASPISQHNLFCQAWSAQPELYQDTWAFELTRILLRLFPATTSFSVPFCEQQQHQPGTQGQWLSFSRKHWMVISSCCPCLWVHLSRLNCSCYTASTFYWKNTTWCIERCCEEENDGLVETYASTIFCTTFCGL